MYVMETSVVARPGLELNFQVVTRIDNHLYIEVVTNFERAGPDLNLLRDN